MCSRRFSARAMTLRITMRMGVRCNVTEDVRGVDDAADGE